MPKGSRMNKKGRSGRGGQWIPLPYPLVQSLAWRSLSGSAVKVFLELRSRFNGGNNGDLSVSYTDAAKLLGLSKSTVSRAFRELEAKGFIVNTSPGSWYGRRAATWAVTTEPLHLPCAELRARHDWKRWNGERLASVEKSERGTVAERKAA
jgi:hypothetical protein